MTQNKFIEELKKIGIELSEKQIKQFFDYFSLLVEWNEKINLTSIIKEEDVYLKHFYDSLTLIKAINFKEHKTLCDVGTGAGFPGIPLKIVFPELEVTLIDSLQKRIKFLDIVIEKLELEKIKTIHDRIEEYGKKHREKYNIVTARAVSSLNVLLEYTISLVTVNGYFIAMKSTYQEELEKSKKAIELLNVKVEHVITFELPIENSLRSLILFKKIEKTNLKYPRKQSEIKNIPL